MHRAEERVEQFKAEHNIVDANGQLVNEQQLSDLNNQLAAARARTAAAKARLDEVVAVQKSKDDIGAFPEAVQSQTITALRSQYAEVMRREAEQMTSLGARHPAVIEIQAQAERLKRMIDDEVNRIALAARADYQSAKASEDLLARNVDALKRAAMTTDAALVNAARTAARRAGKPCGLRSVFDARPRDRRAGTRRHQEYPDDLQGRRAAEPDFAAVESDAGAGRHCPRRRRRQRTGHAAGQVAGRGAAAAELSNASASPAPTKPAPTKPAPTSLALSRRRSATKRKSALPLDELSPRVPVLAMVPGVDAIRLERQRRSRTSRFAAGIRKVYEAVLASHRKRGNPSILIVASDDDNDSAAVALTLAALAAATQRVLLIDADLQRRTLSAIDADRSEAGLVDVAVGRRLLSDAVVRDRDTNINCMPFVSPNSRRDRKIEDEDIRAAFAQTKHFDMVIVAAMELSRDPSARFFAGLVDHIVLVTRADKAERRAPSMRSCRGLGLDARKVRGAVLTGEAA